MISEEILKSTNEGLILKLRISPNSAKNQIIISEDTIKLKIIYIKAA